MEYAGAEDQRLFIESAMALTDADGYQDPAEFEMLMELRDRLAERIARRIGAWIGSETLPAHGRAIRPGDIMVLVQRRGPFVHELEIGRASCRERVCQSV